MSTHPELLPVAVLGAGPVGLAAVAKLIERKLPFFVLEAGDCVGANLLDYGHVRLFSPWQYNVDHTMAKLLEPTGWKHPELSELPLAGDAPVPPFVVLGPAPAPPLPSSATSLSLAVHPESAKQAATDRAVTVLMLEGFVGGQTVPSRNRRAGWSSSFDGFYRP